MTLGPRPGMMMMVLVIISYEYRYLLLLLLLTQLPLAVIDHQSAGIVSTLYLGTLGRGGGEPEDAKGYLAQTLESNLMNSAKVY